MSARRSILVCYDVRSPKRLRRVHKTVKAHGEPLQYSVFLCELDDLERERFLSRLEPLLDHSEDCVMLIDLGVISATLPERIRYIGQKPESPHRGPRIF